MIGTPDDSEQNSNELKKKIELLNQQIKQLELENEVLLDNIERVKNSQESVSEFQNKIYRLTRTISELEEENMELREKSAKMNAKDEIIIEMEYTVDILNKRITDLEEKNNMLNKQIQGTEAEESTTILSLKSKMNELEEYISYMEKENMEYREKFTEQQSGQSYSKLEGNILRLQKKTVALENENKELQEKNQILKAALLLHVDTEAAHVSELSKNPTTISLPQIPKGRVQERVNERHAAMDYNKDIEITEDETEVNKSSDFAVLVKEKRDTFLDVKEEKFPDTYSIHKINEEITATTPVTPMYETEPTQAENHEDLDLENVGVIETKEGRRKCPLCGNTNKNLIREVVDRSKIISTYAGLYGKKYRCGQCGAEWR